MARLIRLRSNNRRRRKFTPGRIAIPMLAKGDRVGIWVLFEFYPFNAFRSLLGIGANGESPTYDALYSGKWKHPTVRES